MADTAIRLCCFVPGFAGTTAIDTMTAGNEAPADPLLLSEGADAAANAVAGEAAAAEEAAASSGTSRATERIPWPVSTSCSTTYTCTLRS